MVSKQSTAPVLGAEWQRQLTEWNATDADYAHDQCIHYLFEAQVAQTPDAVAVIYEGESWTYHELNERANQIAHHLIATSSGRGAMVGVYMTRSLEMVAALLGILKAGAAYVPLEITYPPIRLHWILATLPIRQIVTQRTHLPAINALDPLPELDQIICLDLPGFPSRLEGAGSGNLSGSPHVSTWEDLRSYAGENPIPQVNSEDLAYIIFTSGSTGTPKGVMVCHRPVINLIEWVNRTFDVNANDRILFVTSLSFDLSVYDIFGLLASGAAIHIASDRDLRDPERLLRLLETEPITFWDSAPAALQQLVPFMGVRREPEPQPTLRLVFLSGDWIPVKLADQVRAHFPSAEVVGLGGATEATVWSNYYRIGDVDPRWTSIPYGKPLQNAQYYILDERLRPCPVGSTGRLYIGGECLSLGYSREPVLTAQKFLPHPYSNEPGSRLYDTGDLARFWEDGTIEFLGRRDYQVKIRGFRVELGEIESTLSQHPQVQQTVVLAREDTPGDKRLVAYVVPPPQEIIPTALQLRRFVEERLPHYMVPAAFVMLEKMPLTANGKVDRRALPAPAHVRPALGTPLATPQNPTQQTIVGIWAATLGLDEVGIEDDFFDLGGNSLLATQVIARLRDTFQVELPLRDLFETPTIAGLAEDIETIQRSGGNTLPPPIRRISRDQPLPLSFSQERVWFMQELDPGSLAYSFQATLRFTGILDVAALERALSEIVRRHEILRTTFPLVDGRPRQVIDEPWTVTLPVIDVQGASQDAYEAEAERLIAALVRRPFDPTRLPLLRWSLLRLDEREHLLVHMEHHLIHDGWSFNVFLGELLDLYRSFVEGKPSPLADLPVQFADFAQWQRQWLDGEVTENQLAYWKAKLSDSPPLLELPLDYSRPAEQRFNGAVRRVELPADLCNALRAFSRREGVTLFMTLLAALFSLLHRYSGQDDIVIGAGIANRRRRETETLIGMVINTVALRADLAGNPAFCRVLQQVRQATLEAYANQDVPFDKVVEAVRPERNASHNPLFQVIFGFHDAPLPDLHLPGLTVRLREGISNGSAKFDLNLILIPRTERNADQLPGRESDGMTLLWEYNTDLFKAATIGQMIEHFRQLLEGLTVAPESRLSELSLLTPNEGEWLKRWNDTARPLPREGCVHHLFEAQVGRTPDAPAVSFLDEHLTYDELNCRANRLARYLKRSGVGTEVPVGIYMERSADLVVGLLGILKAGGIYVPLDPTYPPEHIAFLLSDIQPALVLAHGSLQERLPANGARLVHLDHDRGEIEKEDPGNLDSEVTGEHLAYVMYTSGSTGKPKGIEIPHRAIIRLVCNTDYVCLQPTDRIAQASSVAFDAATFEIWGALLNGAHLIGLAKDVILSPDVFAGRLREYGITTLFLTSALFHRVTQDAPGAFRPLRHLLVGGDVVEPEWVRAVLAQDSPERLLNVYGPTETTTFATWYWVRDLPEEAQTVPIGHPIANTEAYVLDRYMQPVPIGLPGELYIGGPGVARGYHNRPELTAERFVPHPFSDVPGARLYRTGDRVRHTPRGEIEFLGRRDDQVKIRGFRIEPGEVEAVLSEHPLVRRAMVLAREDRPGDKRLVAYVILEWEGPAVVDELRSFLKKQLPDYMIPTAIIPLANLPLNANGKIDRKALPLPEEHHPEASQMDGMHFGEMERAIADVWQRVLAVQHVGLHDNFFDLGGSSLLMIQVYSQLRAALQREITMIDLFKYPTVSALAVHLGTGQDAGSSSMAGSERAAFRRTALSQQRWRRS